MLKYSVTCRRREIGIRTAPGARPTQVVQSIGAGLPIVIAAGRATGLAGGIACGRFVESLLFEISSTDPSAIIGPVLVLLVSCLLAAVPPAIRAVHVDPAETLRTE